MIWSLFRRKSPVSVVSAVAKLSAAPTDANRIAFYRSLKQGSLLVAAQSLPATWSTGRPITLAEATKVTLLTSSAPDGGGSVLLAFTDTDEAQKRAPDAPTIILSTRDILKLVMDQGFDGLIINAAGPWAGVPWEDVEKILNGAW